MLARTLRGPQIGAKKRELPSETSNRFWNRDVPIPDVLACPALAAPCRSFVLPRTTIRRRFMRTFRGAVNLGLALGFACVITIGVLIAATEPPPPWAYGFTTPPGEQASAPPAAAPAKDDGTLRHLNGSTLAFTLTQIRDNGGPADWYPGDHPAMPPIVAHGRKEANVWACSLCHYPNGKGRPENAGVAGLPVSYFIQTMNDFKNGARKSADSRKGNTNLMIGFAKAMTDDEIKAAADYFGSMKWTPWIKVVETNTVPKTRSAGGMFLKLEGNDKEP